MQVDRDPPSEASMVGNSLFCITPGPWTKPCLSITACHICHSLGLTKHIHLTLFSIQYHAVQSAALFSDLSHLVPLDKLPTPTSLHPTPLRTPFLPLLPPPPSPYPLSIPTSPASLHKGTAPTPALRPLKLPPPSFSPNDPSHSPTPLSPMLPPLCIPLCSPSPPSPTPLSISSSSTLAAYPTS